MTRLQKKCLIASTGVHALLCLILFAGPAFFLSRDRVEDLPPITLVSAKLVDAVLSGGGGNPNAAPPVQPPVVRVAPPPKPITQPEPVREEPKPEPPAPKPVERHETVRTRAEPQEELPADAGATPSSHTRQKPPKHVIQPSLTVKKLSPSTTKAQLQAQAKADEEARVRAAAAARLEAFNNSMNNIREHLSGGTTVDMPGPGGQAYVNYGQFVKAIYDEAWLPPDEVTDDAPAVQVQVVISRNGDVLSSKILKKSGLSSLDRTVQKTLDRVKFVAPFPEGAKEEQRIFRLNFNLKAKRQLG